MTLLLDQAKTVQFEAFELMQIIVNKDNINPGIVQILKKNRDDLIEFLMGFQNERGNYSA